MSPSQFSRRSALCGAAVVLAGLAGCTRLAADDSPDGVVVAQIRLDNRYAEPRTVTLTLERERSAVYSETVTLGAKDSDTNEGGNFFVPDAALPDERAVLTMQVEVEETGEAATVTLGDGEPNHVLVTAQIANDGDLEIWTSVEGHPEPKPNGAG